MESIKVDNKYLNIYERRDGSKFYLLDGEVKEVLGTDVLVKLPKIVKKTGVQSMKKLMEEREKNTFVEVIYKEDGSYPGYMPHKVILHKDGKTYVFQKEDINKRDSAFNYKLYHDKDVTVLYKMHWTHEFDDKNYETFETYVEPPQPEKLTTNLLIKKWVFRNYYKYDDVQGFMADEFEVRGEVRIEEN